VLPDATSTVARASAEPNGVAELNRLLARPSQKFLRLNTALMTLGAFLDVTCRTFTPSSTNEPAAASAPVSPALVSSTSTNVRLTMPAEPATSRRSRVTAEPLLFGLAKA
jgi:hypothetical protein